MSKRIQFKHVLPVREIAHQISPDFKLSPKFEIIMTYIAHFMVRAIASLPKTIEDYVSLDDYRVESRRRNPKIDSLLMMVDMCTKKNSQLKQSLLGLLKTSQDISQSINNPEAAMNVLVTHLNVTLPVHDIIQMVSQYGGSPKATPAFRIGSVALVDWIMTLVLDRTLAMVRYTPGDLVANEKDICTYIQSDPDVHYFFQRLQIQPWNRLAKKIDVV